MGTRGTYGFRKNGVDKLTYNHFDSYPNWLGAKVMEFVNSCSIKEMNDIYERIVMVDEESKPTAQQIKECRKFADTKVSTGRLEEWYCLLRKAQGELRAYKKGLRYMIEDGNFIKDSLFCEYGYIINLDENVLEFWIGFQHEPQKGNRYGEEISYQPDYGEPYYPCKLAYKIPLEDCCLNVDDEIATMNKIVEENYKQ